MNSNRENTGGALSHVDPAGNPQMVDVSAKPITQRSATAIARILLPADAIKTLAENGYMGGKQGSKGSIIHTAIIAGIQAAKRTSELIPFCHLIALQACDVAIIPDASGFQIECTCKCCAGTGVEMEALTGATAAALCIYDMCKALSFDIVIQDIRLQHKSGGKSDFGTAT
jgi:cyclic pyranopterin monophosphate synthase